ncbi:MAG TPA: M3 family metallopeptidase [Vicinamibacterales bacterium]|nr:M3 family metallopeptidase [Vicinamibacterales bacterium]
MTRRAILLLLFVATLTGAPAWAQPPAAAGENALLQEWTTPFQVPPFQQIKPEHFLPAFKAAIAENRTCIRAIVENPEKPTFANTVEALEGAGELLGKVSGVFGALQGAETNAQLQAINRETTPMLSALRDEIRLDPKLFARIKAVYDQRESAGLTPIQQKLVEDTYKGYVRAGASLDAAKKDQLRKVNGELSMLSVKFADNLLHDTNAYRLVLDRQEDLAGLPASVVAMGADAARAAGMPGKWVYTLQAPSIWPFLQYADNRDLRRQILDAYLTRGNHDDEWDNKKVVSRIAALRVERANLLGYKSHADFVLEENMAKNPAGVYGLLNQLWEPAREMALKEAAALQEQIKAEGGTFTLAPGDWRYYTERVRKAKYDLDDQALRPYFQLENVQQGAFYVANRLYGITFTPRPDLPVYHPEVKAWEVKDADGTHLSVFYTDYHPRPGKRVGAWSGRMRGSWVRDGKTVRPVATNVCNFSRPAGDEPALLTLEEVGTLFHELGHAIATFVSKVPYSGLGGVPRDFVEVPSQIMENWALEPEVLKVYAKHYKTGEVIPAPLVEKIRKSAQFNQGFVTVEYLAASLLDMDWHTLTSTAEQDMAAFEKASLEKIRNPAAIPPRYRSSYYNHIWASGYSAGYYAYIWSEVLDKDAFEAFKETSLFDQATARRFRTEILEKGGSEDAMTMYRKFRGKDPSVEPLLKARGLK